MVSYLDATSEVLITDNRLTVHLNCSKTPQTSNSALKPNDIGYLDNWIKYNKEEKKNTEYIIKKTPTLVVFVVSYCIFAISFNVTLYKGE